MIALRNTTVSFAWNSPLPTKIDKDTTLNCQKVLKTTSDMFYAHVEGHSSPMWFTSSDWQQ